jgi:hypothetical protein
VIRVAAVALGRIVLALVSHRGDGEPRRHLLDRRLVVTALAPVVRRLEHVDATHVDVGVYRRPRLLGGRVVPEDDRPAAVAYL